MTPEIFDNITLYNGDCMDYLRALPDNAFDLAIVDPPYGDGNFQNPSHLQRVMNRDGGGWFNRYKRPMEQIRREVQQIQTSQVSSVRSREGLGDTRGKYPPPYETSDNQSVKKGIWWDIAPSAEYFEELFRVSKNQIIWGGNYFALPPTRCFLIWRKLTISEKFSMAMCEYAWTSFNANAKWFECAPQGTKKDPRFHPTAKPIALYAWILNNYAKEGDKILDTHLGSGSIAIAAHDLGFELTGIEIDKEYYEAAKNRLIEHQRQLTLF